MTRKISTTAKIQAELIQARASDISTLKFAHDAMGNTDDRYMGDKILGYDWQEIQGMQNKKEVASRKIDVSAPGDYGADPIGDGNFRMVPSGDVVDFAERNRRLSK